MEQCDNLGCTRQAEVEKIQDAVFSMTSTSTQSQRKIKICIPCAEQEVRMEQLNKLG